MLKDRWNSFKYAFNGLRLLFQTQVHGKFHVFFAIFVVLAGVFFNISAIEWCFVAFSITLVIAAEALIQHLKNSLIWYLLIITNWQGKPKT